LRTHPPHAAPGSRSGSPVWIPCARRQLAGRERAPRPCCRCAWRARRPWWASR
jgi:hypothetical protein